MQKVRWLLYAQVKFRKWKIIQAMKKIALKFILYEWHIAWSHGKRIHKEIIYFFFFFENNLTFTAYCLLNLTHEIFMNEKRNIIGLGNFE